MSDFKKLPCVVGCPTPSGFVDCNGDSINMGESLARCADIPEPTTVTVTNTVAGHTIATVNVNGTPTDIKETVTAITAVTFDEATRTLTITYRDENGDLVTFDENIPAIDAVIHIGPSVITPPTKYPQYYNQIVTDGNGNVWAFSPDGTPTLLNITQTVTTITDVLSYANKHEIFKYTNEANAVKVVFETVTSLTDALTSGTKIGTYVAEDGTETDIYIPLYSLVALSGVQTGGHAIGTISIDGVATAIKETVTSVTNVLATGVAIGTYVDEAGNQTIIRAPADVVTTITNTVGGHSIALYTNELGAQVNINETVTTFHGISYNKATSVLTAEYTDEAGVRSTYTAQIVSQATAYINGTNPNTATIFSLETPPTVTDNALKNNPDYVYVGTDGSYWFWNGTSYVTAPVPAQTTEWYIAASSIDAKESKTNKIARPGWVTIGKNVIPESPLDVFNTGVTTYSVLARFLNPDNAQAGRNTQLIFGAAQSTGNAADWRYYHAGNNSSNNRIDFGFSGYAAPMLTYTVGYKVGVRTSTPNSTLQVKGSLSLPIRVSPGALALTEFDHTVLLSSGGTTQPLPSAAGIDGRIYVIKNNGATNCFVSGAIQSSTTSTITLLPGACRTFQALGGQWWIISGVNL